MNNLQKISIGLVVVTTLSLYQLVPENPFFHLDDPSYWGVICYCTVFLTILFLRLTGSNIIDYERFILTLFLAVMPLIYIANWIWFDTTSYWIYLELVGQIIYLGFAILSSKKYVGYLALGIAAHGLWDLWHINQNLYVPNWYAIACAIIDLAVGLYVFSRFRNYIMLKKSIS